MSPKSGRFLGRDPIGFSAGANFYRFIGSSPLRYLDASGLRPNDYPTGFYIAPSTYTPSILPNQDWQVRPWLKNRLSASCSNCNHCNPEKQPPNGCDEASCLREAMDIGNAVGNTLEMSWGNWNPNPFSHFYWGPNNTWIYTGGSPIAENERYRGYFCSRWAEALLGAIRSVSSKCFASDTEFGADTKGSGRLHVWAAITSNCSGEATYVDDHFWNKNFGNVNRPCGGEYVFQGTWDPNNVSANMGPYPPVVDANLQPVVWPWKPTK